MDSLGLTKGVFLPEGENDSLGLDSHFYMGGWGSWRCHLCLLWSHLCCWTSLSATTWRVSPICLRLELLVLPMDSFWLCLQEDWLDPSLAEPDPVRISSEPSLPDAASPSISFSALAFLFSIYTACISGHFPPEVWTNRTVVWAHYIALITK